MRKMKDSGLDWIGEIPSDWDVSKIKYHCSMQSGDNITASDIESEGEYKVYGANGFRGFYNQYNCEGTHILIGRQGALAGNVHIVRGKYWATDHAVITKITDNTIDNFLYYALVSANLNQYAFETAAQPGLAVSVIINKFIPYPPFAEQEKIANFLDEKCGEIDSIRTSTIRQIELLNEYKKSFITEAVTKGLNPDVNLKDSGVEWIGKIPKHWIVKQLKRIAKVFNGKEIEDELDQDAENAIKVYGSGGVFKYTNKYLYKGEAVLFGRKGTIGKPLLANGCFWTVDTMYYSVCFPNNDNRFLYYILKVFPWEPYTTQTALPSVVASEVFQNSIGVPPFSEQKEIADYLDEKCSEIDSIVAYKQKQIEILDEYKKSLIFEYVTGKKEVPV